MDEEAQKKIAEIIVKDWDLRKVSGEVAKDILGALLELGYRKPRRLLNDEEIVDIGKEMMAYAGWRWDEATEEGKEIWLYRARHIMGKAQLDLRGE